MADLLNHRRFGHQFQAPGSQQAAQQDIGHQQGLAGVQGQPGQHRSAGEDQEHRKDNRVVVHDVRRISAVGAAGSPTPSR